MVVFVWVDRMGFFIVEDVGKMFDGVIYVEYVCIINGRWFCEFLLYYEDREKDDKLKVYKYLVLFWFIV